MARTLGARSIVAIGMVLLGAPSLAGQTLIEVNAGEVLTEADLLAGSFGGSVFELNDETVFQINTGGAIGPVGEASERFDANGAAFVIRPGGAIVPDGADRTFAIRDALLIIEGDAPLSVQVADGSSLVVQPGAACMSLGCVGSNALISGGDVGVVTSTSESLIVVQHGASIGQLRATAGGSLRIEGGVIGDVGKADDGDAALELLGSGDVEFSTGIVTGSVLCLNANRFHMRGDAVIDGDVEVGGTSAFEMSGGRITGDVEMAFDTNASITGGSLEGEFIRLQGQTLITGGDLTAIQGLGPGGVQLVVRSASIDGVPVDLLPGESILITERGGAVLEIVLSDGTAAQLILDETGDALPHYFAGSASLELRRVESECPGDCDQSGAVDFNDLLAIIFTLGSDESECDTNSDGTVTFDDVRGALFRFGPCDPNTPGE